jgi:hypothetical protein
MPLRFPLPQRLVAERAFDAAGNGIANPDDSAEQQDTKGELKCRNHESFSVILRLPPID